MSMSKCTICMEKFKYNDEIIKCKCKSIIHEECYFKWVKSMKATKSYLPCPYCRRKEYLEYDIYDIFYYLRRAKKKISKTIKLKKKEVLKNK